MLKSNSHFFPFVGVVFSFAIPFEAQRMTHPEIEMKENILHWNSYEFFSHGAGKKMIAFNA